MEGMLWAEKFQIQLSKRSTGILSGEEVFWTRIIVQGQELCWNRKSTSQKSQYRGLGPGSATH